jgi:hypothetical protein
MNTHVEATKPGHTADSILPASEQTKLESRNRGYGLPCSKCRTYYPADVAVCPICKSTERVSPTANGSRNVMPEAEGNSDVAALEAERERFLKEFKSQVYASHMQINAAASFRCSLEAHHGESFEPATVCQACYNHLQERVDVMEAALQEATQLVYEAVWADTSDSSKTYQNAAQALLAELRRRAGISTVLGPLQPLPH